MSDRFTQSPAVRIPAMAAVFCAFAVAEATRCNSLSSLLGGDIWWHLRTGLWILQNHALPHTALFTQADPSSHPWIAASWLYDVKLAVWYKLLGLAVIPVFLMFFRTGLAVVTFLLAGGRHGNFWPAVVLSAVAQYLLMGFPPTPAYCSVLLFAIELLLLLESRRAGPRILFWLAPLFLAWANIDIHFVDGIVLLLLFLIASCATARMQAADAGKIAAAAASATLISPYFYRPYAAFLASAFNAANSVLPDYKAPGFRQPQDYVLLLFAMAAFLALGLRRSRDPFLIILLGASAAVSFHSQREVWLVILAAVAVIGETAGPAAAVQVEIHSAGGTRALTGPNATHPRETLFSTILAVAALVLAAAFVMPHRREDLLVKAAVAYPVAASDYIREHHLPQPLFNAFEWGGFLTFALPEYPVAIDSRIDIYGDDYVLDYSKVMNAEKRYTDYAPLANARTILLPRNAIMAQALSTVPAYKVAYSDNVAMVLTRQEPERQ